MSPWRTERQQTPPRASLQEGGPVPASDAGWVRDDLGGQCADPRLVGAVRCGSTWSAAAWCGEVLVQDHRGVAGRAPGGPVGRGVPGVARRLEEPSDIQGVVVAETAGVRVGLHDQRGANIRQGHLYVKLGCVGQDRAGRNIHGRQEQTLKEAGISSGTRSPWVWLGIRRPR